MAAANGENVEFTPREFQVELLQIALKKNIIVCSGTGTGKTFISVMLIKELQHELVKPFLDGGKRTIFISKTVPLVTQQYEVLTSHLALSVGKYSGDMGVDFWDKDVWLKEFVSNEVLVMTSQILVNLLSQCFLDPRQINLLIIDECHHAVGGDPVTQIMKRLLDFKGTKPRILGLTAAVLNGKCKREQVETKIRQLEVMLGAVVETPSNLLLAATFKTKPCEKSIIYKNDMSRECLTMTLRLTQIVQRIPTVKKEESFKIDNDDWFLMSMYGPNVKLSHVLQDLVYTTGALGMWCANEIAKRLLDELKRVEETEVEDSKDILMLVKTTLTDFVRESSAVFARECEDELESMWRFTSDKVKRLMEILKTFNDEENKTGSRHPEENKLRGIIFVDRRVAAWMLSHLLNKFAEFNDDYAFMKTEPVMGHGADPSRFRYASLKNREQQKRIKKFRKGECNLLIATRVVEEGMDIPTCNVVIRFDPPMDFRSYVQSKGRARSKDSYYILLLHNMEKEGVLENIRLYDTIEQTLYKICKERLPPTDDERERLFKSWILPSYYVGDREGPCVSCVEAISRVNWYCQLLPRDQLTTLSAIVLFKEKWVATDSLQFSNCHMETDDDDEMDVYDDFINDANFADLGFHFEFEPETRFPTGINLNTMTKCTQCAIKLPLNSPIKDITLGDLMPNKKLAKMSVGLKVVEILHKAGELNDQLLPVARDPTEFLKQFVDIEEEQVLQGTPKPGSKKRRQAYKKEIATVLQQARPVPHHRVHVYKISIASRPNESGELVAQDYGNKCFAIVTSKHFLKQMEPFPLFSRHEDIWVKLNPIECTFVLSDTQIAKLDKFQGILFETLLKISSGMFERLNDDDASYLIAPLRKDATGGVVFDWELIGNLERFQFTRRLPGERERQQFAFEGRNYQDAVVVPLHDNPENRRMYMVKNIECNACPSTKFPGKNVNFIEYYKLKYNIQIQRQDQPLLESYHVRKCINLLALKQIRIKKKSMCFNGEIRDHAEFLVPELSMTIPIPASLFKQAVMLPSILYRVGSLCAAEELGHEIIDVYENVEDKLPHAQWSTVERACQIEAISLYERDNKKLFIESEISWERQYVREHDEMEEDSFAHDSPPASILLKALTACSANDFVNYERLESLGDSFLKYATSVYLFCQCRNVDEGRLTLARSKIVSNNHLYHLGKKIGIGKVMRTEKFSPHLNWLPPHMGIDETKEEILYGAGIPFSLWKYLQNVDLSSLTVDEILEKIKEKAAEFDECVIPEVLERDEICNDFAMQMINDKSIADCIEALIGAHLLYVGPDAALRFLKWIGVKIFPLSADTEEVTELNVPTTAYFNQRQKAGPKLLAYLDTFQEKIGYTFKDISFLVQAFTHPSYYNNLVTDCYQRLEFLGDAVLDYLVTWHIFKDQHNFNPGNITDLRSALVNNETFARLAVENHFDPHLKELNTKLFDAIRKFKQLLEDEKNLEDDEDSDELAKTFGNLILEDETLNEEEIEVPKALGDIFESVAGAIYLDSGLSLDVVWDVYSRMFVPLLDKYTEDIPIDPVRKLHELFPKVTMRKIDLTDENDIVKFRVVAELVPGLMCEGYGKNAKLAKRSAAKNALRRYGDLAKSVSKEAEERASMLH